MKKTMNMEIRFAEQDDRLVIAFIGDLDNTATPEAETMLKRVYERDDCDILLECIKLNYISSRGLRLLVALYKHARNSGHKTFITHMNKNVKEVLEVGGFLDLYQEIET